MKISKENLEEIVDKQILVIDNLPKTYPELDSIFNKMKEGGYKIAIVKNGFPALCRRKLEKEIKEIELKMNRLEIFLDYGMRLEDFFNMIIRYLTDKFEKISFEKEVINYLCGTKIGEEKYEASEEILPELLSPSELHHLLGNEYIPPGVIEWIKKNDKTKVLPKLLYTLCDGYKILPEMIKRTKENGKIILKVPKVKWEIREEPSGDYWLENYSVKFTIPVGRKTSTLKVKRGTYRLWDLNIISLGNGLVEISEREVTFKKSYIYKLKRIFFSRWVG